MTYLLAAGCSWTDYNFQTVIDNNIDCSFAKWPEILGNKLGIPKVINLGLSGCSNNYIFDSCYDQIILEKPKLVCILLTEWDRRRLYEFNILTYSLLLGSKLYEKKALESGYLILIEDMLLDMLPAGKMTQYLWEEGYISVKDIIDHTLRQIFLFQSFCIQNDIKFLIMQAMNPIGVDKQHYDNFMRYADPYKKGINIYNMVDYIKYFIKSPYSQNIDESSLLGWPFFWEIGGRPVTMEFENSSEITKFFIHENDFHPNKLGHEVIAYSFYKGYIDVYNKTFSKVV